MAANDNPYESPKTVNGLSAQASPLSEDAKEFLGIAKHDFWYYPGFVLLVAACFFSNLLIVGTMFFASTVFLLIFLAKSFPKYVHSRELAAGTRLFGFVGNVVLIALQIVVVSGKSWLILQAHLP